MKGSPYSGEKLSPWPPPAQRAIQSQIAGSLREQGIKLMCTEPRTVLTRERKKIIWWTKYLIGIFFLIDF